jgi:5-methylcytosine-specific restriction protein A
MSALAEIKPSTRQRVIDLVHSAGLDISDWANYRGGAAKAATNPRYCYAWAFIEPGAVVILNLWYQNMRLTKGRILQTLNLRQRAAVLARTASAGVWKTRALQVDQAIQTAYRQQLPVRVIVCDGTMRLSGDPDARASRVQRRLLDPRPWAVTAYNWTNGQCTLVRGATPHIPVDCPLDDELEGFEGTSRERFIRHRRRETRLRGAKIAQALRDNGGRLICEVPNCRFDFFARYGAVGAGYAQVHHTIPLSAAPRNGRSTRLRDLAIVCANCHAMIHRNGACRPLHSLIPPPR